MAQLAVVARVDCVAAFAPPPAWIGLAKAVVVAFAALVPQVGYSRVAHAYTTHLGIVVPCIEKRVGRGGRGKTC